MSPNVKFSVSDFIAVCNQSLEYAFSSVIVEGEVASFKVSQGKWVFFDLKEGDSSVGCFLPLFQLRMALQDGMKVQVRATPTLTRWGKFSLTVSRIQPVGQGSIKQNFELLKRRLQQEGLFDPARKRPLPAYPTKIGVISSTEAAGYADFCKILAQRWGGLKLIVAHTQVQGLDAPEQIVRALNYLNQHTEVDVIAILRGGGSADDLAAFNDEALVRAIAASRTPVITGIGHEIDESLADLAADLRAATPSNAAELLTPDRRAVRLQFQADLSHAKQHLLRQLRQARTENSSHFASLKAELQRRLAATRAQLAATIKALDSLSPEATLARGYAILSGKISPGSTLTITTHQQLITTEVKNVQNRTH